MTGGVLASGFVAAFDACYAAQRCPSFRLFFAELGLIAPLGVGVGFGAGAFAWLFLPPAFPRVG
ncbi:MAG TPA: hypothetical protein VGQ57_07605, partial [Polyangiaceae bacterium]|nr:hypothetical protein [Polyangiaceae bacterium]